MIIDYYGKRLSTKEKEELQGFVNDITVLQLEQVVVQKTIVLRQEHKIKLPDAIIAATALTNGMDLISHNVSDFKNITGLFVFDPWLIIP